MLTGVPKSLVSQITKSSVQYAECLVQNTVRDFGEPHMFICTLFNSSVKSLWAQLGEPLQKACADQSNLQDCLLEQGMMVAVADPMNCWSRGVLDEKDSQGLCHIIRCDHGMKVEVMANKLKSLPEQFKEIPRFSVACTIVETFTPLQEIWATYVKVGAKLRVCNLTKMPDREKELVADLRTPDGRISLGIVHITDWLPLRPPPANPPLPPALQLPASCDVVITTFCSASYVYVRPVDDKVVQEQFYLVQQDLTMHCLTVQSLGYLPVVGSLVAILSGVDGNFYRALVTLPVSDTSVMVVLIDYGNREHVTVQQIYPLNRELASVQCLAKLVSLAEIEDDEEQALNMSVCQYFIDLVNNERVLSLTYQAKNGQVMLTEEASGVSVNQKVKYELQGSWMIRDSGDPMADQLLSNYSKGKATLDVIPDSVVPVGNYSPFVLLHWPGNERIACCLAWDPLLRYVVTTLTMKIDHYVSQSKQTVYVPHMNEICLAKYEGDGLWYRAMAKDNTFETSDVCFIDFGNTETVSHKNIRKMPHDFNEVPMLATYAHIAGLEKSDFENPELIFQVGKILISKSLFEGIVLKVKEATSEVLIFIPKLVIALIEEKLIPESRVDNINKLLKLYKQNLNTESIPKFLDPIEEKQKAATNLSNILKYQCEAQGRSGDVFKRTANREVIDNIKKSIFAEISPKNEHVLGITKSPNTAKLIEVDTEIPSEPPSVLDDASLNILDKSIDLGVDSLAPESSTLVMGISPPTTKTHGKSDVPAGTSLLDLSITSDSSSSTSVDNFFKSVSNSKCEILSGSTNSEIPSKILSLSDIELLLENNNKTPVDMQKTSEITELKDVFTNLKIELDVKEGSDKVEHTCEAGETSKSSAVLSESSDIAKHDAGKAESVETSKGDVVNAESVETSKEDAVNTEIVETSKGDAVNAENVEASKGDAENVEASKGDAVNAESVEASKGDAVNTENVETSKEDAVNAESVEASKGEEEHSESIENVDVSEDSDLSETDMSELLAMKLALEEKIKKLSKKKKKKINM